MVAIKERTCSCGTTMVRRGDYRICEHCDIPQQHSTGSCLRCRRLMTIHD